MKRREGSIPGSDFAAVPSMAPKKGTIHYKAGTVKHRPDFFRTLQLGSKMVADCS
jgi:hypothetical protein